jgi:hypothetical protein
MDFLRRLAPAAHAGAPRALPLLAPRFAAPPLGLAAGDADHDPLGTGHEQAGGPAGTPAQVTPGPSAPAAMAPAMPWYARPGAAHHVNAGGSLADNASNAVPHTFEASADRLTATTLQLVQLSAPSAQAATAPKAHASRDLNNAAVPRAENRAPERTNERTNEPTHIHPNSRATWAPQATATPHAAPLSAAALAAAVAAAASAGNTARQPSRSQAPPVIHVTIDRIDVRAAPGPTRPASAPRR